MSKPYNYGPCIPDTLRALLNQLPPQDQIAFEKEINLIDRVRAAMSAVEGLAWFLPAVSFVLPVIPVISPGIYDVEMDETVWSALGDWYEGGSIRNPYVLVAGHHPEAESEKPLSCDELQLMQNSYYDDIKVVSQVLAANTPAQAIWIAKQIKELGLPAVALRTHPSHMARLYMTVLKELEKLDLHRQVVLLPWWKHRHPYHQYPLTRPWEDQSYSDAQLSAGEAVRICNYVAKGDVATPDEVESYMKWLFTSSPAAPVLNQD
jgi:hypothetical protein